MSSEVDAILKLQNLDLDILDIQEKMDIIPDEIQKIEAIKKDCDQEFVAFEEGIKKQKLAQKELEGEIESQKAKLQKLEMQLHAIKTNNEYTAMLKEIDTAKHHITETEDKLLGIMEVVENHDLAKARKKQELEERNKVSDARIQEFQNELQTLTAQMEQLKKERHEATGACSGALYLRYERFIKKKKSIALVPLEKHGACSGCHRNLPPNIRNEVIKGKVLQCDNCSRLLFWPKGMTIDEDSSEPAETQPASEG